MIKEDTNPGVALHSLMVRVQDVVAEIPEEQKSALVAVDMFLAIVTAYQGWVNALENELKETKLELLKHVTQN